MMEEKKDCQEKIEPIFTLVCAVRLHREQRNTKWKEVILQFEPTFLPFFCGSFLLLCQRDHYGKATVDRLTPSYRTSTASSMTVMSVLHLAEGLMASSAGGMTKLLLNGSHIPSPKVYVNLQRAKWVIGRPWLQNKWHHDQGWKRAEHFRTFLES